MINILSGNSIGVNCVFPWNVLDLDANHDFNGCRSSGVFYFDELFFLRLTIFILRNKIFFGVLQKLMERDTE